MSRVPSLEQATAAQFWIGNGSGVHETPESLEQQT
jgi:hypothetical protein